MPINSQTALIVGASRGIGLALTQQLLTDSATERVCATFRQEDTAEDLLAINDRRLEVVKVDITSSMVSGMNNEYKKEVAQNKTTKSAPAKAAAAA